MDFALTEDQEMLRRSVREFAETEIKPKMMAYDESQEFPWPLVRQRRAGLIRRALLPDSSARRLGYATLLPRRRALARGRLERHLVAAHNSLCTTTSSLRRDRQRRLLPKLAKGEGSERGDSPSPRPAATRGHATTAAPRTGKAAGIMKGAKTSRPTARSRI